MEPVKPAVSQKEYLKRYLMKDKKTKVKKKKSNISSSTHLKRSVIIDDDINIDEIPRVVDDTFSLDHLGDEAPQIVGIIDERPEQVKLEEKYKSGAWKPLKSSDRSEGDDPMPDFSRNGRFDSFSPAREVDDGKSKKKNMRKRTAGSDASDSDLSPPRHNKKKENVRSSKENDVREFSRKNSSSSKSDRSKRPIKDLSEDSDLSPPRNSRKDEELDRRAVKNHKSARSEDRKKSGDNRSSKYDDSDSDLSPPRSFKRRSSVERGGKRTREEPTKKSRTSKWSDLEKHRGGRRVADGSDSDLDVPRKSAKNEGEIRKRKSSPPPRHQSYKNNEDSDLSPPRRDRTSARSGRKKKSGNDSDLSPPRKTGGGDSDLSPPRKVQNSKKDERRRGNTDQMQDGKRAGLQDAKSLKDELRILKEREDEMYSKMDPELLGRSTAAIVRDRKTGLKRDLEKERQIEREKSAKNAVRQQKYDKWGKGLKQVKDQEEKVADMVHEMSKPLARYADDDDLERALKAQEREGDPMLEYIKRHQKESHAIDLTVGGVRKKYNGSFLPNRFGIAPGHRWDGVDRSNGYEQKWFEAKNAKKATLEEAWKWSSADM